MAQRDGGFGVRRRRTTPPLWGPGVRPTRKLVRGWEHQVRVRTLNVLNVFGLSTPNERTTLNRKQQSQTNKEKYKSLQAAEELSLPQRATYAKTNKQTNLTKERTWHLNLPLFTIFKPVISCPKKKNKKLRILKTTFHPPKQKQYTNLLHLYRQT